MATEGNTPQQKRLDPEREYEEYATLPDLITAMREERVDSQALYIVADAGDVIVYGRYAEGDSHEFFRGSEDDVFQFVASILGAAYVRP